jgi:nucleoside-diphosphate-sugar epimerase
VELEESMTTKRVLVCGAGGFIGGHLVRRLKDEGHWVRGADWKEHEYATTTADEFLVCDLRDPVSCRQALDVPGGFDEVFQLAADMGGMGFIHSAECEIMRNNVLINVNMIDAAVEAGVQRYLYTSSVCIYRDMDLDEPVLTEAQAYPAQPDNEYGWEKLYSERVVAAFGRRYPIATRIARFQNTYGPEGTWRGGREKAPAAICRKVAEAENGGQVEVWGDGTAVRSFTYIDDLVEGIILLMASDMAEPTNIGSDQYVTVRELVETVAAVAGKSVRIRSVDGPVGVRSRNFSHDAIKSLGWQARISLREGVERTYPWVAQQVQEARVAS